METKFTKGDWKTTIAELKDFFLCAVGSVETKRVICHTNLDPKMTSEECKANANLISAAPDMFNALKDLYDDREVWSDLFESQQEFICRVLNKATDSSFFQH